METKKYLSKFDLNDGITFKRYIKFEDSLSQIKKYIYFLETATKASHIINKYSFVFDPISFINKKTFLNIDDRNNEKILQKILKNNISNNNLDDIVEFIFNGISKNQIISNPQGLIFGNEINKEINLTNYELEDINSLKNCIMPHILSQLLKCKFPNQLLNNDNNLIQNNKFEKSFDKTKLLEILEIENEILDKSINIALLGSEISYVLPKFKGLKYEKEINEDNLNSKQIAWIVHKIKSTEEEKNWAKITEIINNQFTNQGYNISLEPNYVQKAYNKDKSKLPILEF